MAALPTLTPPSLTPPTGGWLEQPVSVVAVEGGLVLLEPVSANACGSCASRGGCGGLSAGEGGSLGSGRRFWLPNTFNARLGEELVVGMASRPLLWAGALVYLFPVAGLMGGVALGLSLGGGDGQSLLAGLGGLALGAALAAGLFGRLKRQGRLTPRFLRKL